MVVVKAFTFVLSFEGVKIHFDSFCAVKIAN